MRVFKVSTVYSCTPISGCGKTLVTVDFVSVDEGMGSGIGTYHFDGTCAYCGARLAVVPAEYTADLLRIDRLMR